MAILVDNGKSTAVAGGHELDRSQDGIAGSDCFGLPGHYAANRRVEIGSIGHGADGIPLGKDADQAAVLADERGAALFRFETRKYIPQRPVWLNNDRSDGFGRSDRLASKLKKNVHADLPEPSLPSGTRRKMPGNDELRLIGVRREEAKKRDT
jgi:hypothetical protein